VGRDRIAAHEVVLRDYATRRLSEIGSLRIVGTTKAKGSIVSFVMDNAHPHDIATVIDRAGVAVRAGHHCAQPAMERFGVGATTRASFGMYNTLEEVDWLAEALIDSKKFFG
jgi:cysteine desulfurase/selenocysteine lyase